ncbi:MAG: GAF and ANTAR domain-containing protein [Actinomycetes bacterium]
MSGDEVGIMADGFDDTETLLDVLHESDIECVAERVVRSAAKACEWDHASVMVLFPRRTVDVLGVTDDVVRRLDEAQLSLNEGPCLDAVTKNLVVTSPDIAHDERWPAWGRLVAQEGFGSMLSVRLFTGARVVGALNAYLTGPRQFDQDHVTTALVQAHRAAALLALSQRHEELKEAVDRRHHIGIAQGILMSQYDLDEEAAFEVLHRYARSSGRKLRDVASEVIARRRL